MKWMWLPFPHFMLVQSSELALPIRHPIIKRVIQFGRSSKEMQMIRHDDIITDKPFLRCLPDGTQMLMCFRISQPRNPIFGANCGPNDIWSTERHMHSPCRLLSPSLTIKISVHATRLKTTPNLSSAKTLIREGESPLEPKLDLGTSAN